MNRPDYAGVDGATVIWVRNGEFRGPPFRAVGGTVVYSIETFHVTDLAEIRAFVEKYSQNRTVEEFDRTVEHLRREWGKAALVASEMEARRARFYPPGRGAGKPAGA